MREIRNKQGDIILSLSPDSCEWQYWSVLVSSMSMGFPALSENRCAQLLVWLYQFGGGYEAVTQNKKMFIDITFAQYHFNVYGASIIDNELIKQYNTELYTLKDFPDWCNYIFQKYNLSKCKFTLFGKENQ